MINERLKELRKSHKITQKQLATDLSISERNYQDLEYGKVKPSYDTLILLANYYDISLDFLTGRSNNPEINR